MKKLLLISAIALAGVIAQAEILKLDSVKASDAKTAEKVYQLVGGLVISNEPLSDNNLRTIKLQLKYISTCPSGKICPMVARQKNVEHILNVVSVEKGACGLTVVAELRGSGRDGGALRLTINDHRKALCRAMFLDLVSAKLELNSFYPQVHEAYQAALLPVLEQEQVNCETVSDRSNPPPLGASFFKVEIEASQLSAKLTRHFSGRHPQVETLTCELLPVTAHLDQVVSCYQLGIVDGGYMVDVVKNLATGELSGTVSEQSIMGPRLRSNLNCQYK